jgi:hypothetical protein
MLSSLLRPKRGRRRSSATPLLFKGFQAFRNATPSGEDTADEAEEEEEYDEGDQYEEENDDNDDNDDDDDDDEEEDAGQPILPIFSAPVLGVSIITSLKYMGMLVVGGWC